MFIQNIVYIYLYIYIYLYTQIHGSVLCHGFLRSFRISARDSRPLVRLRLFDSLVEKDAEALSAPPKRVRIGEASCHVAAVAINFWHQDGSAKIVSNGNARNSQYYQKSSVHCSCILSVS